MLRSRSRSMLVSLVVLSACGTPVDSSGKPAEFVKASVVGGVGPKSPDRPLAADLAVEPVAMLVMFNRLQTPEKLQEALNMKAGRFSHLDLDSDATPDPLTVMSREVPDGHAFEIRVKPKTGEFVVATMVFDPEWEYVGHYSGLKGGAASTQGQPLKAEPLPGAPAIASADAASGTAAPAGMGTPAGAGAPAGASVPAAPVGTAAPAPATGTVAAANPGAPAPAADVAAGAPAGVAATATP